MQPLLLMSGGVDSASIACWQRPAACLFVDYGQAPALGEYRAASQIAAALGVELHHVAIDCVAIGSGTLAGKEALHSAPSPEWWPYRNQLLGTIAAAWGLPRGFTTIWLGAVRGDRERHVDGSPQFIGRLNDLVSSQEGSITIEAPAVDLTTDELLAISALPDSILAWTHSCHTSAIACGTCSGCVKRHSVLTQAGRLL